MHRSFRPIFFGILACLCGVLPSPRAVVGAQTRTQPGAPLPTFEAVEAFLLQARVVSTRAVGSGVTESRRATLTDGTLTHDAQIQTVDVAKDKFDAGRASEVNFRDSYRYNIAAYRLSRLLGMDNVPVSVSRAYDGKPAAFTWWLDIAVMTEKQRAEKKQMGPVPLRTSEQLQMMQVFDELIQNKDRNGGNIVWGRDWKMWLIDHTRAFRTGKDLVKPDDLKRCDAGFLRHLRELTEADVNAATGSVLSSLEREALLVRRDLLVRHFDARIKTYGAANVLFGM